MSDKQRTDGNREPTSQRVASITSTREGDPAMHTFEFGIDKTIRCYARATAESAEAAKQKIEALVNAGAVHLIDAEHGIDYTDTADDAPRFDIESMQYIQELDERGEAVN